ncbi:protein of unknown function [Magnetospirillum gryphiswaldense MSR-1 v2]|uniref:Uncharacterized protein n=1 Tax=Magnetospirillum gryphiswaldense (strain DSM 6361 / JCM 21280 / NBRC 15271 / MSR-1) TaxID=431944 RepID=V6F2J2_MAGGM|nr:protein of unknown function [Magnetospirillum gryphiswaldense MSR-1 v2]
MFSYCSSLQNSSDLQGGKFAILSNQKIVSDSGKTSLFGLIWLRQPSALAPPCHSIDRKTRLA